MNDQIILDTQLPSGDITLIQDPNASVGYSLSTDPQFMIERDSSDVTEYALFVSGQYSCQNANYTPFPNHNDDGDNNPNTIISSITLNPGIQLVQVCLKDQAGQTGQATTSVIVDDISPIVISASLISSNYYLDSPLNVPIAVNCLDDQSQSSELIVNIKDESGNGLFTGPYTSVITVNLPINEGESSIEVTCTDSVGLISEIATIDYFLDTTPPQPLVNSVTINDGDALTTSRTVSLAIEASDGDFGSGIAEMSIGQGGIDCDSVLYQTYSPIYSWSLPDIQGETSVSVCLKDFAGNSILVSDQIILDTQLPSAEISLIQDPNASVGYSLSTDPQFMIERDSSDVIEYALFVSGQYSCQNAIYTLFPNHNDDGDNNPNTIIASITLNPGTQLVQVCLKDQAGQTGQATTSVIVDDISPIVISASLVSSNYYLDSPLTVPIAVNCGDDQSQSSELIVNIKDESGNGLYFGPYTSVITVNLPISEGESSIEVTCTDSVGLISEIVTIDYFLDTTPPQPLVNSVMINDGDAYTTSRAVTLTIQASDNPGGSGIAEMSVGQVGIDCDSVLYQTYSPLYSWSLPDTQGEVSVSACLKDFAGNSILVSDQIILDTQLPSGDVSLIQDPDASVGYSLSTDPQVMIERNSNDVTEYALFVSGQYSCQNAIYTLFPNHNDDGDNNPNTIVASLTLNQGIQLVQVCLKDQAGQTGQATTSIIVDQYDPAGYMVIDANTAYTTSRTVSLSIFASDGVTEMKLLNDQEQVNCSDSIGYVPVSFNVTHTLTNQQGQRTVKGCLKKASGRYVQLSDQSIIYDSVIPEGLNALGVMGININSNDAFSNSTNLSVRLKASDADNGEVNRYKLSDGGSCQGGVWKDWSNPDQNNRINTYFITQPADNILSAISVIYEDKAGNQSACYSDDITIDTTPLEATQFIISSRVSTDSAGRTSTIDVQASSIGHSGDGGCERYELSLSNDFLRPDEDPLTFDQTKYFPGCPLVDVNFTLDDIPDGNPTVYFRVLDTAGNLSSSLPSTIYLDKAEPELQQVEIERSIGSQSVGDKYSNSYNVNMNLINSSGADAVLYCLKDNVNEECDASDYINRVADTDRLTVSFNTEGLKKVCVKLIDDTGNTNDGNENVEGGGLCDEIIIDVTAPPAPTISNASLTGVNASCANIFATLSDANDYLRFESRPLGGSWSTLDEVNSTFNSAQNTATIYFDLTQDSDNLLQVRVIDKAGNTSETTDAIVEEVSSFLIPTDLVLKQTCNGGEYGILKESLNVTASYTRPTCHSGSVFFEDVPDVALLDFSRLNVRRLSPVLTIEDLSTEGCVGANLENSIIDAACSPEPNQPMMIVARPELGTQGCGTCMGTCCIINTAKPPVPSRGKVRMLIMTDPIGQPHSQLIDIGDLEDSSGDGYALNSIDVVDWMGSDNDYENGDYPFRGLMSDVAWVYGLFYFSGNPVITQSYRTYVRRIEYTGLGSYPRARDEYHYITGRDNVNIHGLSIFNVAATYLFYDDSASQWSIYKTEAYGSEGTPLADFSSDETDESHSPFRTRVHPANRAHTIGNPQEGRINTTYLRELSSSHRATAYRAPYGGTSQRTNTLGTVAPAGASFFEVGYRQAWWVDADDPRVVYMSTIYGQNPMRLKYAIDTSLPIFPSLESTQQLGEPFLIYHTTGVTRGVVVAYLNENDTSLDECAE